MASDELNESAPFQDHPAARDRHRASCADDLMDDRDHVIDLYPDGCPERCNCGDECVACSTWNPNRRTT